MSQKEHEVKGRHSLEVGMSQRKSLGCARQCKAMEGSARRKEKKEALRL